MQTEIRPKHGSIEKIAKAVGCSRNHVSVCLRGIVDSELSGKIRAKALELGGVEVKSEPINN